MLFLDSKNNLSEEEKGEGKGDKEYLYFVGDRGFRKKVIYSVLKKSIESREWNF